MGDGGDGDDGVEATLLPPLHHFIKLAIFNKQS